MLSLITDLNNEMIELKAILVDINTKADILVMLMIIALLTFLCIHNYKIVKKEF